LGPRPSPEQYPLKFIEISRPKWGHNHSWMIDKFRTLAFINHLLIFRKIFGVYNEIFKENYVFNFLNIKYPTLLNVKLLCLDVLICA
jgi:hypothetical protein